MAQLAEEGREWSLFVLSADATFEEQVLNLLVYEASRY